MHWDVILGYATGLRLVAPEMDATTLIRTLIVVHLCHASMCRVLAHNKGYSKTGWSIAGLLLGIWAFALLMALPAAKSSRPPQ